MIHSLKKGEAEEKSSCMTLHHFHYNYFFWDIGTIKEVGGGTACDLARKPIHKKGQTADRLDHLLAESSK